MKDNKKLTKKMSFAQPMAKRTKGNVPRIVIFRSPMNKNFYFHLQSANGKILFQSEGYNQMAGAKKGIAAITKAFTTGVITIK